MAVEALVRMLLGYVVQLWSDGRFSFSFSAGMQLQKQHAKKKETMRLGGGCCEIGPRRKLRAVGALSAGGPDSNSSPLSPHLSLLHPALMVPKSRARCFARARAPHPPRRSRAGPRTAGAEENRGRALMM